MPDAEIPVRFELSINGNHIATGGVRHSVLSVDVLRVARNPASRPGWIGKDEKFNGDYWHREEMTVEMGGLDGDDSVRWVEGTPIKIGDEIIVRILGPGVVDEVSSRKSPEEAFTDPHKPAPSDATREAQLRELDENLDKASLDLLGSLNSSAEAFSTSMYRYQHAASQLMSALTKACGESEGDEAEELDNRRDEAHDATRGFRRHLLAYRKSIAVTEHNS